jgi:hypothetical protein
MKRLIVGTDDNAARIYHQRGKRKLTLINEVIELASKFIEIDSVKEFIESNLTDYLFNRMIANEPNKAIISRSNYFLMYSVPEARFNALNEELRGFKDIEMNANFSNYDLKKDFGIYIQGDESIRKYRLLIELIELVEKLPRNTCNRMLLANAFWGFVTYSNDSLCINSYNLRNL